MEKDTLIPPEIIETSVKDGYVLSIDRGVSNCLKFVSAIMIALHHYSQFMVHTSEYQHINGGGAIAIPTF